MTCFSMFYFTLLQNITYKKRCTPSIQCHVCNAPRRHDCGFPTFRKFLKKEISDDSKRKKLSKTENYSAKFLWKIINKVFF